jgi:hypothetical protein
MYSGISKGSASTDLTFVIASILLVMVDVLFVILSLSKDSRAQSRHARFDKLSGGSTSSP